MSTSTAHTPADSGLSSLQSTARALFVGLAWGAVMLILFGFWIRAKHAPGDSFVTHVLFLAGAAAALLAGWQMFALWFKVEPASQKAATLGQQRRIFSYVLLGFGLGLIALAFYLGVGKKTTGSIGFVLDNLPESLGALLLGLIALGCGYHLTLEAEGTALSPIGFLTGKIPVLKLVMIILAAASIIGFVYVIWVNRVGNVYFEYLTELVCLVFFSVLCIGCLFWLNNPNPNETSLRMFVLVFGGASGVILFVESIGRTIAWRQDIFLGGAAAWQGPNAWHFWLCAYLLFFSLILMFVSFNLARTDIRSNVYLRRLMYGYDAIAQCLLLVAMLVVFNIVVYAMVPFTFDWTKARGAYALSDSTKNMISGLKKEINVFVLTSPRHPAYKDLHLMFDNAQALSNNLKVTYMQPEATPMEYEKLVRAFPKIAETPMSGGSRGVLLVAGKIPDKEKQEAPPHEFVADTRIYEREPPRHQGEKPREIFKGEAEIMKDLKFLLQDKKKQKVYVLQGNGELDINNMDMFERPDFAESYSAVGFGRFMKRLEAAHYEASGLSFAAELTKKAKNVTLAKEGADKKKSVPEDCQMLIIPGPSKKMSEETLDAIDRYLDAGGRAIVFFGVVIDPKTSQMIETGLESVLKRYGVEVSSDFVLRFPIRQLKDDARSLIGVPNRNSQHVLAREFSQSLMRDPLILRRSARVLKAPEGHGRFRAETIVQLEDGSPSELAAYAIEKNASVLPNAHSHMTDLAKDPAKKAAAGIKEPVPVVVAVSEGEKPRLLVFSAAEPITNMDQMRFQHGDMTYALVTSAIEWMSDRESIIGAPPRVNQFYRLGTNVAYRPMYHLPAWLMFLTVMGVGIGVWVVRRR